MRPPFSKSNSSGGSSSNNSNRNSTKRRTHSKAGTTTILHPMLLLLVLLFASLRFSRASYTIEVPHGQEECVYVRVPAKSFIRYVLQFAVLLIYYVQFLGISLFWVLRCAHLIINIQILVFFCNRYLTHFHLFCGIPR